MGCRAGSLQCQHASSLLLFGPPELSVRRMSPRSLLLDDKQMQRPHLGPIAGCIAAKACQG